MVKIRLKRLGRKKRPYYRVVVMDIRERRQGAPLAEIGFYNPLSKELKLDKQAATSWIQKGAGMSPAVERLMKLAPETGELIILEKAKKERLSKKAKARLEAEEAKKAEAAATPAAPPTPEPVAAPPAETVSETPAEPEPVTEDAAVPPSPEPVAAPPAETVSETPAEPEPVTEDAAPATEG